MKLLLDNNLPPALAHALSALCEPENEVVALRDKSPENVEDVDYFGALKSEGNWAVVSGDRKITRVPHERAAWRESGLTVFFLERGWSKLRYWDICWRLVRWWPTILVHAQTTEAGISYLVPITSTKLRVLR